MWKLTIPDDVLETLRCSLCKEYLSQLPIYSYPNQEGVVACGRCPILSEESPIRNVSYETIAKFVFFPCRYKPYGCVERVLPACMQEHEECCMYKHYFCPFIPLASCPWQGPAGELFSHYDDQHNVFALQNSTFEIDLTNMYEDNYLLIKDELLFVIHIKRDVKENVFWCSVRLVGNKLVAKQLLQYQITLKNHNDVDNHVLNATPVDCDGGMNLNKELAVCIDIKELAESLNNPSSIICNVNILPNQVAKESINDNNKSPFTTIDNCDEEILRELECPVCSEYMVPPIHQCVAGHSICANCKGKVRECPTCREKILDTRNFSLEKMTRIIKYCCKYRDFNCLFVSGSEKIRKHETDCKFGPHECLLRGMSGCKWKGKFVDIMDHTKQEHEKYLLESEVITWSYQTHWNNYMDLNCFLMQAHGEIFKLNFEFQLETFIWSVELFGSEEEADKYMYELDFIDNSNSNQRLFIRRNCTSFINSDPVSLDLDHLESMMDESNLVCKCRIIKK